MPRKSKTSKKETTAKATSNVKQSVHIHIGNRAAAAPRKRANTLDERRNTRGYLDNIARFGRGYVNPFSTGHTIYMQSAPPPMQGAFQQMQQPKFNDQIANIENAIKTIQRQQAIALHSPQPQVSAPIPVPFHSPINLATAVPTQEPQDAAPVAETLTSGNELSLASASAEPVNSEEIVPQTTASMKKKSMMGEPRTKYFDNPMFDAGYSEYEKIDNQEWDLEHKAEQLFSDAQSQKKYEFVGSGAEQKTPAGGKPRWRSYPTPEPTPDDRGTPLVLRKHKYQPRGRDFDIYPKLHKKGGEMYDLPDYSFRSWYMSEFTGKKLSKEDRDREKEVQKVLGGTMSGTQWGKALKSQKNRSKLRELGFDGVYPD